MTDDEGRAWLPNLARGVSVWNLVGDLNRPDLFDGRLLIPRIEGPANLPRRVEWNVTDLVPLVAADAAAVAIALADLARCAERAALLFAPGASYAEFAGALTLPSPEAEPGCYFFDPSSRKLLVKNWGARRRAIAQAVEHVIDCAAFPDRVRARPAPARTTSATKNADPYLERRRWPWLVLLVLLLLALVALALGIAWSAWPRSRVVAGPIDAGAPDAPSSADSGVDAGPPPPPLPAPHQKVFFDVGVARFGPDQLASLGAIAAYLEAHPEVRRLRVEGHADDVGQESDNLGLSVLRARGVADWLLARGVGRERIEVAGCSERYPVQTDESEPSRRHNRRVELFVIEPPVEPRPHAQCDVLQL